MRESRKYMIVGFLFWCVGSFDLIMADHPSLLGCIGVIGMGVGGLLWIVGNIEISFENHEEKMKNFRRCGYCGK